MYQTVFGLLAVVYGRHYQVTKSEDWIPVPDIVISKELGPDDIQTMKEGEVDYLIVDRRLSLGLPFLGFYFEQSEEGAFQYTRPLDLQSLTKFDHMENVSLIFDSGNIRIYAIRKLWDAK